MSLRERAIKGVFWSAVQNWGSNLLATVVFLILANLLDVEAFGLVALASVFTAFLAVFRRQGFSQAIVQRADLTPGHLDTAFWLSAVSGLLLAAALFASAGLIAQMWTQPLLAPVLRWLSITVFIAALGTTTLEVEIAAEGYGLVSPGESVFSPGFVEVNVPSGAGDLSIGPAGGASAPMTRSAPERAFGSVTLSPAGTTGYTIKEGTQAVLGGELAWKLVDIADQVINPSGTEFRIPVNSSLLLAADGGLTGTSATIEFTGAGAPANVSGAVGQKHEVLFDTAGVFTATAKIDGGIVGTVDIVVIEVSLPAAVAVQLGFMRTVSGSVTPASEASTVVFEGSGGATVSVASVTGGDVTLNLTVSASGGPVILARLSPGGPVISAREVDEFATSLTARTHAILTSEDQGASGTGFSTLVMRPFVSGLEVNFQALAGDATFAGGVTEFTVTTSEAEGWVVDPQTGEGKFAYEVSGTSFQTNFFICHSVTFKQENSPGTVTIGQESAANPRVCTIILERNLYFVKEENDEDRKDGAGNPLPQDVECFSARSVSPAAIEKDVEGQLSIPPLEYFIKLERRLTQLPADRLGAACLLGNCPLNFGSCPTPPDTLTSITFPCDELCQEIPGLQTGTQFGEADAIVVNAEDPDDFAVFRNWITVARLEADGDDTTNTFDFFPEAISETDEDPVLAKIKLDSGGPTSPDRLGIISENNNTFSFSAPLR